MYYQLDNSVCASTPQELQHHFLAHRPRTHQQFCDSYWYFFLNPENMSVSVGVLRHLTLTLFKFDVFFFWNSCHHPEAMLLIHLLFLFTRTEDIFF